MIKFRKFIQNNSGSAVPLILYVLTIVLCGALYTLFFIEVFYPLLAPLVSASDSKTYIMMCFYAIPLFVMVFGVIAVIRSGLKRYYYPEQMYMPRENRRY